MRRKWNGVCMFAEEGKENCKFSIEIKWTYLCSRMEIEPFLFDDGRGRWKEVMLMASNIDKDRKQLYVFMSNFCNFKVSIFFSGTIISMINFIISHLIGHHIQSIKPSNYMPTSFFSCLLLVFYFKATCAFARAADWFLCHFPQSIIHIVSGRSY